MSERFSEVFHQNINMDNDEAISSILSSNVHPREAVNQSIDSIYKLFQESSEKSFPCKRKFSGHKDPTKNKPWFGSLFKTARKNIIWLKRKVII